MEPLQSIEEAANTLRLSPWTVRRYVSLGRIRPVRIGRRVLIEQAEIERVIEEGRQDRACENASEHQQDRSSPRT